MASILVTGGAGFIGSHLCLTLKAKGHDVYALDSFSDYYEVKLKELNADVLKNQGIPILKIDLAAPSAHADLLNMLPSSISYIFHGAAQPGISNKVSYEAYLQNNIIANHNLLEHAKASRSLQLFVYLSTSSVYGLNATLTEKDAPCPASWYGMTKLAAEQECLALQRRGIIQAAVCRLFSVYGPRERPDKLVPKLLSAAFNKKPFTLHRGSGQHIRSFTYISDIVDGIFSLIDHREKASGKIYNIGTEAAHTTQEVINAVQKVVGSQLEFEILPPREGDQNVTTAVIDAAKRDLSYMPKVSLEEGIMKTAAWFEEQKKASSLWSFV
jgi:UDP-glucuronate 4-epimerase